MKYSFLGYCVKKIMEFDLDVKDLAILRYFDDFTKSGRMTYEVVEGVKYYWISYKNIEDELPFLGLAKRAIMMRMLKLRDLGVLSHYTKKEGGTFSYYALGEKYGELLYIDNISNSNNDNSRNNNIKKDIPSNEEVVQNNIQGSNKSADLEDINHQNEEPLDINKDRGYAEKCSTKINLLNNSSTRLNTIYNNIKEKINSIISYLNLKAGVMYKSNNTKTIKLVKARLREGFTVDDFKTVIDKKVKSWKGSLFEQYLTPFTLFGNKFEVYLNQNISNSVDINRNRYNKTNYNHSKNLRFHNFKGRDCDYDALEKKLLGWE